MFISINWLNDYIDLSNYTLDEITKSLTQLGIEVEGINIKESLDDKLIVGRVVSVAQHPNADSLHYCKVEIDESGTHLDIVCGATNVTKNMLAVVATVGSKLPDGTPVKESKIRGQISQGMLCSEKELDISSNHDEIIDLKENLAIGSKLNQYIKPDAVLELGLTPNMGHCLSYIGIARELSAFYSIPLIQNPRQKTISFSLNKKVELTVKVKEDSGCQRFVALYMENIKVVESPLWLKQRLELTGLRSVNLIVDATNYIMLESGQPIHAYDYTKLDGKCLQVCKAGKNFHSLITLDDKKSLLDQNDIIICDKNNAVGIAGVMGGKNSEIDPTTNKIVIEVANFSPSQVRRTAKRLNTHTESSHRFERELDINQPPQVANKVATFIASILQSEHNIQAKVADESIDFYPTKARAKRIAIRVSRTRSVLGYYKISISDVINILERLCFKPLDKTDDRILFEIPSWRNDVNKEIDLIEEVGRLVGFDNIPYEMPKMNIQPHQEDPFINFKDFCRTILAANGLTEVITYPFFSKKDFTALNLDENHIFWPTVSLNNALNEEQRHLQTTQLPGLLKALEKNRNRNQQGSRFFEVGRGYFQSNGQENKTFSEILSNKERHFSGVEHINEQTRPFERTFLSGILDNPLTTKGWDNKEEKNVDFFSVKELIFNLFSAAGIHQHEWTRVNQEKIPFLHPKASAFLVWNNQTLGWIGELHPRTCLAYNLGSNIPVIFELDIEAVYKLSETTSLKIESTTKKFPSVSRDLSLLVNDKISFKDLETSINSHPKQKHQKGFHLFDIYKGENIEQGWKSFAATLTFQSEKKTLTDGEIDKEMSSLVKWLKDDLGATQR